MSISTTAWNPMGFTGIPWKMFATHGRKMPAEVWWTIASIPRWPAKFCLQGFRIHKQKSVIAIKEEKDYARSHISAKGLKGYHFKKFSLCVPTHGFSVSGLHRTESEHVASLIGLCRTGKREQKAMFHRSKNDNHLRADSTKLTISSCWVGWYLDFRHFLFPLWDFLGAMKTQRASCVARRASCALWGRWQQDLDDLEAWMDTFSTEFQPYFNPFNIQTTSITRCHKCSSLSSFSWFPFHVFHVSYGFLCLRVGGLKLPWGWRIGCWKQHYGVFCVSSVSSNHCNGNSDVTSNAEVLYWQSNDNW